MWQSPKLTIELIDLLVEVDGDSALAIRVYSNTNPSGVTIIDLDGDIVGKYYNTRLVGLIGEIEKDGQNDLG